MSVIGPRPLLVEYLPYYTKEDNIDLIYKKIVCSCVIRPFWLHIPRSGGQNTRCRLLLSGSRRMKAFYTYLEEKQIISENPFRRIRTKFKEEKVLPRIIPKNDIERLLNYMYGQLRKQKGKNILRDLAVVEMFFATGARVYEISNIRIENIDMKTGSIYFNGKGRKERVIQIGEQSVIKLLQKYYEQNKAQIEKSGYFFVNQKGDRFSEQSIRRMLKKYTKQSGISRNITPHMFRHSFATYLIEEGVDISCVQQILGHSSIKTTQIYIHVAAGIQAEILQKKHPRNKMHIWAA